jgi:hypothetical protein
MSSKKDISFVLQKYAMETGVYSKHKVESDFADVAQQVSAEDVTTGLSEAIRSEQTQPFDQMVGQSFEQGDAHQRAGMLNQLLDAAGPTVVKPLMESGVLQGTPDSADSREPGFTPEMMEQMHPGLVQQIAQQAELENPGIIDRMSTFYAEDPHLVKTLEGGTLNIALIKIAEMR